MSRFVQHLVALSLLLLIVGCGANHTSIYRSYSVDDPQSDPKSVLIDAKQRAILAAPATRAVYPEGKQHRLRNTLVCAEPSPDALSAISSTFAASAGGLFPSGEEVQAALASALEETATELGRRNATIQLLRDGLYRQCEAYMNGLIDEAYYEQIANKYANAMVTLLAIEELTGNEATLASVSSGGTITATAQTNTARPLPPDDEAVEGAGATLPEETDEAEGEGAGSSARGTATAPSPTVSVKLPQGGGASADHISTAVNTMVTWFLTKDTVDYCLRALFTGIPTTDARFKTAFIEVCSDIVREQMAQQGQIATAYEAATGSFGFDDCSAALRTFWKPDGTAINTENEQRIRQEMEKEQIAGSITLLIRTREKADARRKVGASLGLLGCT